MAKEPHTNGTLNAILQNAAARAETAGIAFQTTVVVPERLPIPDEDLCILLMNLLDNAIEGAARTPADQEKHIRLQMRCTGGHLAIFCENSYDGKIASDHPDHLRSRKGDALLHGFGLAQMRQIAEKYGSILDVRPGDTSFTVQTALLLPKES